MESPSPWTLAAVSVGRTALGASFFPLGTALAYAAARTYGAAMAVLLSGAILFGLALVATLVLLAAGGRSGGNLRATAAALLGGSLLAVVAQIVLAVMIAVVWASKVQPSRSRPIRHRSSFPKASTAQPNPFP